MPTEKKPEQAAANYGIQASTVRAGVMAVGHGARAQRTVGDPGTAPGGKAFARAIEDLQKSIASLKVSATTIDDLRQAVAALELSVKNGGAPSGNTDRFVRLQKKLKDAGVVLTKATTIGTSLSRIAKLLGLSP